MVEFIEGSEQWDEFETGEEAGQERTAKGRHRDNATCIAPWEMHSRRNFNSFGVLVNYVEL
jgi:hypothetical protein